MKKKKAFFVILTILLNIIIYLRFYQFPISSSQIIGSELYEITGEIKEDNFVEQEFIANGTSINSIKLFLSTFGRENTGTTNIDILDRDNNIIISQNINNKHILDNDYTIVKFDKNVLKKDKIYKIKINSRNVKQGITCWEDKFGKLIADINYDVKLNLEYIFIINIIFILANIGIIKLVNFINS